MSNNTTLPASITVPLSRFSTAPLGRLRFVGVLLSFLLTVHDLLLSQEFKNAAIGIILSNDTNRHYPKVVAVIPDSPAANAGIRPDDELIAVSVGNNVDTLENLSEKTLQTIREMIQGPQNTFIVIKVRRTEDCTTCEFLAVVPRTLLLKTGARANEKKMHDVEFLRSKGEGCKGALWMDDLKKRLEAMKIRLRNIANQSGWFQVANGISEKDVLRLLGAPSVTIASEGEEQRSLWRFGCLEITNTTGQSSYYYDVYVENGIVIHKDDPFYGAVSVGDLPTRPRFIGPGTDRFVTTEAGVALHVKWHPSAGRYPIRYLVQVDTRTASGWLRGEYDTEVPECSISVLQPGMIEIRWQVKAMNATGSSDWSRGQLLMDSHKEGSPKH